jgi:hypothetical protein
MNPFHYNYMPLLSATACVVEEAGELALGNSDDNNGI